MKKGLLLLYCVLFFAVCLTPLIGMAVQGEGDVVANEIKVQLPHLRDEDTGKFNAAYFDELTAYVDKNFAGRQSLITANAKLSGLLGETGSEKVIRGKDGWLFFAETTDDYLGRATISEREAFAIAQNLETMKQGVEARGGRFFFTIAPNKNSLYGQYMPDRYQADPAGGNYALLSPYLDQSWYVDLFAALKDSEEPLYHRWDSHWNKAGALRARDALMEATGKTARDYSRVSSKKVRRHRGDLYEMVYPKSWALDWDTVYDVTPAYTYVQPVRDDDEPLIETWSEKEGNLVMYRDSFGIALLPLMADEYGRAYFSKETPYDLEKAEAYLPGDVIIELVERNLPQLCETVPVMAAPVIKAIPAACRSAAEAKGEIELQAQGDDLHIVGETDGELPETEARYWVQVKTEKGSQFYAPFYVGENGFSLRIKGLKAAEVRAVTWYYGDEKEMHKVVQLN